MNKSELIAEVAAKAEITKKDADAAVTAVIDAITESLKKGDKVQLVGFGTFEAVSYTHLDVYKRQASGRRSFPV